MEFIKFWRTSSGNEVDFVIDNHGFIEKEAFEIKFNSNSFKEKKYKKFMNTYPDIKLDFRAFSAKNNSTDIIAL